MASIHGLIHSLSRWPGFGLGRRGSLGIVAPVEGVMRNTVMCGGLVVGVVLNRSQRTRPMALITDRLEKLLRLNERAHRRFPVNA